MLLKGSKLTAPRAARASARRVSSARPQVRAAAVAANDIYSDMSQKDMYSLFESLLDKSDVSLAQGEKVNGRVVGIDKKFVYVDLGLKDNAVIPHAELSIAGDKPEDILAIGETREFQVIRPQRGDQQVVLSIKALEVGVAWERARQQMAADAIIDAKVLELNKGGVLIDAAGLRGFLPISQIHPRYTQTDLIGQVLPVKYIDVDQDRQRLVFSNKKALAAVEGATDVDSLKVGDVVSGTVQSVKPYGCFVELNGLAGLLHVSQISNERVTSPEGLFTIGEQIKCMVLAVDKDKGRVSLSTKKLEPSAGDMLRDRKLVYDKADEMARLFKERVAAAEAAVRASEA